MKSTKEQKELKSVIRQTKKVRVLTIADVYGIKKNRQETLER